ncbi:condensation domain-containing protein [Vibrio cholerae]
MSTIDIHQLSTQQLNALISKVKANTESSTQPLLAVRVVGDTYPVSASQQSVWLVSQDPRASAAYNITMNLLVKGTLDVIKLGRALDEVVQRHTPLRTGYRFDPSLGQVQQFLCETAPTSLRVETFDDESDWQKRMASQLSQPLNFEQGEVYRVRVAKLGDGVHILSLVFHHIAFDGWSMGIFLHELKAFYLGEQGPLPPISNDYIDVASSAQGTTSDAALAYWQQKLANAPVTRLPAETSFASGSKEAFEGAVVKHRLGTELVDALSARCHALGMSNFMLFSGALQYLVGRYNDTQESVIGSYVSGRDKFESQPLIGCFVNNIVLRQVWCESDSIQVFLDKVKTTGLEALANQAAPFPEVVKTVGWQGDGHPLYQVGLVMQPESVSLSNWGELELTAIESESAYAHMDLEVYVWPKGDAFELVLNYDCSRYSAQRIQWLAEHYERVLTALATSPLTSPLQEVDIITSEERAVLNMLDGRRLECPDRLSSLAERLAAASDDHIAVIVSENAFRSSALTQRVTLWMETFAHRALHTGDRVAFWGERGFEQQALLAACTLYGVTYVPMDSSLPEMRCQQILQDARPNLLVVAPERLSDALRWTQVEVVAFEATAKPSASFASLHQVLEPRKPSDEFALLYTSGTTGTPKGVSLSVAAANARLNFAQETLTTLPSDRVLQRTPLGFVDALWEVLDTMISGATSVVALGDEVANVSRLASVISTQRVSKLYVVPSLLRMLSLGEARFPSVRHLYSTAEPFSLTLLLEVQTTFPNATVFNLYGSTEVNDVTWLKLCADSVKQGYLGQVVPGAALRVEDRFGRVMPIGCPGEIVISGQQQLRHYTNHPQSSVHSNNQHESGFRMGDVATVLPNGWLRLLGRQDGMVKIRGNRVEVLEVQLALRETTGDSGAVAYFSAEQQALIGCWTGAKCADHVRQQLLQILPNYMVPSQLYALNHLPLLPHGKVNMVALKQLVAEAQRLAESQTSAAETEQEQALAAIYARALQVRCCAIDKNVFDLGLSSLELNQVQHDINTTLGLAVDVVTLLQYPTIRALANHLDGSKDQTTKPARRGQRTTIMRRRTK